MSVSVPARLLMVLLLCAAAVACGDAPSAPEDVAREYLTAYWANDYERLYEVLAPSATGGRTRAEWVAAKRRFETTPARAVTDVALQPDAEGPQGLHYNAVLKTADGKTFADEVLVVATQDGWRASG